MDIYKIRRENLLEILNSQFEGKIGLLASRMNKDHSQISRLVKPHGGKPENVGPGIARQIENVAGKPEGWLDRFHGKIAENVVLYKVDNPEDLAEEKALFFADEFERQLEIRLSAKDKRELFKRMRDRYLRQITSGQKVPEDDQEMIAEVIDFIEISKQINQ